MLGKVTTNEQTTTLTTVPGVGENLVKIFASIDKRADNGFWQQDDKKKKAKEMFKELKKLFISTKTKFRFETSNLRRALLEVSFVSIYIALYTIPFFVSLKINH